MPNKSASNACFVNLTKNESNPNQISGKGVHELRTVEPDLVAQYNCSDFYKRNVGPSALELLFNTLLTFY